MGMKELIGVAAASLIFGGNAFAACTTTTELNEANGTPVLIDILDGGSFGPHSFEGATVCDPDPQTAINTADIAALQSENASQQTEIDANAAKNVQQDNRLNNHDIAIQDNADAIGVNSDLIADNTAAISNHTKRLDTLEKGVAISLAMPDTWLSPDANFAIAGNFGGFGDAQAVGFAAIARIEGGFSVNGKIASDTNFDEYGFSVGARAEW